MRIKPPKFWYDNSRPSFLVTTLYPISKIYSFFAELSYKSKYECLEAGAKVIAVGGLTIGGSGKTPIVIALCDLLKEQKKQVAVVTRGYGRISKDLLKVDPRKHTYLNVGDEALLIAKHAEVYVGTNRTECVRLADNDGYNLVILDDGLTQKHIKPNIKLLVIDNQQKFGNGYMLPLGPNRLNFDIIKDDIDAVIIVRTIEAFGAEGLESEVPSSIPILIAETKFDFSKFASNERVLAFCGIGYAGKFFETLSRKMNIVKKIEFPDHYSYSDDDITDLIDEANLCKARLVTTEKDLMRIHKQYHDFIRAIPMKIKFEAPQKVLSILKLDVK